VAEAETVVEYLPLPESRRSDALAALSQLPAGCFVIASGFEGVRAGVVARAASVVADDPLLVCVSLRRGHWIEPLIRDSRAFAISVIDRDDKFSLRKFCDDASHEQDPFDCTPWESLQSQSPILKRAAVGIDCEVVRRVDLEADCSLIIGRVIDVRLGATQNGK
jgi:flavin reductase (DIM6/NTAB) family NADH-FMN oxidoreductase RutF